MKIQGVEVVKKYEFKYLNHLKQWTVHKTGEEECRQNRVGGNMYQG